MGFSLYEIDSMQHRIKEMLEADPTDEEAIAALENIQEEWKEKVIAIGDVMAQWSGEMDLVDAEIKRLQAIKKSIDARYERLRTYVGASMLARDIQHVKNERRKVYLVRGPDRVEVTDGWEEQMPMQFIRIKKEPDKVALKAALEKADVPGATLVKGQERVSIK